MLAGNNNADNVSSRPFFLGLLLLVIFLSIQTEWAPRRPGQMRPGQERETPAQHREAVKEKIILDLSISNEKLEDENRKLKIDVFTLRRELRNSSRNSNMSQDGPSLLTPMEVLEGLNSTAAHSKHIRRRSSLAKPKQNSVQTEENQDNEEGGE